MHKFTGQNCNTLDDCPHSNAFKFIFVVDENKIAVTTWRSIVVATMLSLLR